MKLFNQIFKNLWTIKVFVLILSLMSVFELYAQTNIKGIVTDESGDPLIGVTVLIKGTSQGVITSSSGEFSIQAKPGDVMEFTYLGMLSQNKKIREGVGYVEVAMKEDATNLEDVVVVAYGAQKKVSLTAAVAQVSGDDLRKTPMTNISQGLQGLLPGISSVQSSGQPGADDVSITLRGSSYGVTYIVDGVPRSISDIDPNDVESISLLKDGAATAVYGLKSSGGVIIVTTKQGRKGPATVTYKGSVGASMNTSYPEFLDGPGYAYWYNKALEMDGQDPVFTKKHVEMITNDDPNDGWGNTNWIDEVFGVGITQQHSVTSQGGTDKINYFTSVGYMGQKGNIDRFNYDRYNLRSNINAKIAHGLKLTVNLAGSIGNMNSPGFAAGGGMGAGSAAPAWLPIAEQAAFAHPYIPMEMNGLPAASRNAYGNVINPLAAITESGENKSQTTNIQTSVILNWDIPWVKGLNVRAMGSYDRGTTTFKNLATPYKLMLAAIPNSTTDNISYSEAIDPRGVSSVKLSEGYSQWSRINSQLSLNYANQFGSHRVEAMALIETRDYKNNNMRASAQDLGVPELPELSGNGAIASKTGAVGGASGANRSAGFIFRAKYDYYSRYLIEFSGRYDGSYKFIGNIPQNRWGFFPSVSAAWRISEENFFSSARDVVDNLKLRASFGSLGSDNVGEYAFLSTFGSQFSYPSVVINGDGQNGLMTSVVANPYLTWERQYSYNVGLDLTMWNGRLGFEADAFYIYTFDILGSTTGKPDSMGGYYPSSVNNNARDSKGFEITLSHRNKVGDFSYGVVLKTSYAKSRWLTYMDAPNTPNYQKVVGTVPGSLLGLVADGLFQSEEEIDNSPFFPGARPQVGDIKYKDLNGDGIISHLQDRAYSGRGKRPRLTGSLNLFGNWKGLDLNLLFIGGAICDVSLTGTYYNYNDDHTIFTRPFKAGANSPAYLVENSWTPDNPDAEFPRLSLNPPNTNNSYASTFWYRDGKYLRLKSAQLGYTLPRKWTSAIGLGDIRIYCEGQNLFTWSGLPEGIDPEWPNVSNGYYPQQKTILGGLQITF